VIYVVVLQIVPADLNAFLHQMERNIAWAANKTGDAATSHAFNEAAAARKAAMQALLWDNTTGGLQQGVERIVCCCSLVQASN
jgi:alpha,alpha-trehalase